MKITIDTKQDSEEEIRHAIQLLSRFVEKSRERNVDIFSDSDDQASGGGGMFNMFDQGSSETPETSEDTDETIVVESPEDDSEVEIISYD